MYKLAKDILMYNIYIYPYNLVLILPLFNF